MMNELALKYGCNPNQSPSRVYMEQNDLPFEVLNGHPGYINLLDALNGWQLVRELKASLGLPAAASFKHVSPAGAAIGVPLDACDRRALRAEEGDLSPIACAYVRARGADRMSSFGDFAALSDECDASCALFLSHEVSDGIIAPGYTPEALEILKKKKRGLYTILKIDASYEPAPIERKMCFGVTFEQHRNDVALTRECLTNIVTQNTALPEDAARDLVLSLITLKYTQSNSVCYAYGGQVIGVGAGQQSRIHCTRLAGSKADLWFLRRHPRALALTFDETMGRPDQDNAIEAFCTNGLSEQEKADWMNAVRGVSLGSDAFFPFGDSIERAARSGVCYVAQPGGSKRDAEVTETCDRLGIVMAMTGIRLFHH